MIIELFQRADGLWRFRRIAVLGVQEDPKAFPSRAAALAAAHAAYPGEAVSDVAPEVDPPFGRSYSD